jgi:deoxyribodipyrimidine photo-lyase
MRELNSTGYMHNRVRMVVASFLTKDLHIDWRAGEKYFAQQLVDYDPAVNNGNWQWAASTGCDAQPYFRIFNPWLQQEKFDAECIYIKHWLPELAELPPKIIHTLTKS